MSGSKGTDVTPKGLQPYGALEGRYMCDVDSSDAPSADTDPNDCGRAKEPAEIGVPAHSHPGGKQIQRRRRSGCQIGGVLGQDAEGCSGSPLATEEAYLLSTRDCTLAI